MTHDMGNFAPHVKLADAVGIVLVTEFITISGYFGTPNHSSPGTEGREPECINGIRRSGRVKPNRSGHKSELKIRSEWLNGKPKACDNPYLCSTGAVPLAVTARKSPG